MKKRKNQATGDTPIEKVLNGLSLDNSINIAIQNTIELIELYEKLNLLGLELCKLYDIVINQNEAAILGNAAGATEFESNT